MALRLNRVGNITRLTREGSGHLAISFRYLRSLEKHDQHCGHDGGSTHYSINNKASMPDNIYPGVETYLITDRDNDPIKGIRTSAAAPTHTRPRFPGKKPHASGKNPWAGTKAANIFTSIQDQGPHINHAPPSTTGQDMAGQGIHPPYPRALGKSRGKPARLQRPPQRLRSEAKPVPLGSGLQNPLEYHPPHHQEVSRTGPNTVEASN
jgi:hypothetical protein